LRKIKNRFLDTAYAATHLGHLLTSEGQLRADHLVADRFNADAEDRGWDIRLRVFSTSVLGRSGDPSSPYHGEARAAGGGLQLIALGSGAIEAAVRDRRPDDGSSLVLTRLLQAALQPPTTEAEFRAMAAKEYNRRVRQNAVGADFLEITDRIDDLIRKAGEIREGEKDHRDGTRAYWKWALWRQGIEGTVPTFWPMRGAAPKREYHHISRVPLREYTQVCRLRLRRGWLICFRQKGGLVRSIPITSELEARYLAVELMPPEVQRRLERDGRLYKLNCWFDYLGRVPVDTRRASGVGFSHDAENANEGKSAGGEGTRPDLMALEKLHEERLKNGLESNIRHAPQGGTVKIAHPAPAIRHAELKRDMASYNDKHGSYMGTGGLSRRLRDRKSLNIPKPDPLEVLEHKITENLNGCAANENVRNDLSQYPVSGADRRAKRTRHRNVV